MIKNRKAQLVFLAAACTIGIIGIFASVGFFEADFRWDFYIYYTNVSNYFCVAVMILELLYVLRCKDDGYIAAHPLLKFMGLVGILLTFFMFNIIMAPEKPPEYLFSVRSVSLHVLIPIMYTLDWFLFYERKKTTWKYPLLSLILPISYLLFVLIHAAALKFDSSILCYAQDAPLIYPYFFLDYGTLGVKGMVMWVVIIISALAALGFLLFFIDRLSFKKRKNR